MRALHSAWRGGLTQHPTAAYLGFNVGVATTAASAGTTSCPAASCSPRCTAALFFQHRRSSASRRDPPTSPAAVAAVPSDLAAAGPGPSSAMPLRFRARRHRLTALERAAAAAHEALAAQASRAAASAPAPSARSAVIPSATPLRSGSHGAPGMRAEFEPGEKSAAQLEAEAEAEREAEERKRRFVGQLQAVPHVIGASEQLLSARKRAGKVAPSAGIRNEAEKERSRAARRLDVLMKELSVPLSRYVAAFPQPERLHPFEAALLALTVGEATYRAALDRVDRLRKAVQEVGKGAAGRAAAAPNKASAVALSDEGAEAIETVFTAGARHVDALKEVAKKLRSLPSLDTSLPTVALVGAPNVGKSSLVNILSSGTPEVCNYPFTTRSIKMGHFYLDSQKHQVTDTPGLLRRPDTERNRMEQLTLAALGCLDTAVLFVVDLTEECGTSVDDQWAIRSEVRARFPERPWIDVMSKADMLAETFTAADSIRLGQQQQQRETGHAAAAAASLAAEGTAAPVAPYPVDVSGSSGGATRGASSRLSADEVVGVEPHAVTAVEVICRLPGALRISSLTHDGIPQLQLAIIRKLREHARARHARQQQQQHLQQQQMKAAPRGLPPPPPRQQIPLPPQQLQQQQPGGAEEVLGRPPVITFFTP